MTGVLFMKMRNIVHKSKPVFKSKLGFPEIAIFFRRSLNLWWVQRQSLALDRDTLTDVFAIEIYIRLTRCHMASEKLKCWSLTQHTSFYLTSYVTDITHRRFFIYLYQPIHWYLTRILMFLSEQRAPFSTMFASRAFHNTIWSQHSTITYKFQYSWHVWTPPMQGHDCDRLFTCVCSICYDMILGV